jgi:RNA polymerase sigma-70 factor (ECF subfamily)
MQPAPDPIATRRSLLSRLKNWGDDASWQDFHNTYSLLIYNVALRSGLSETEAQDVVQETELTVAKKISEFSYDPARGTFKGWLCTITKWRIADQFRKWLKSTHPPEDDSHRTPLVNRIPDEEAEAKLAAAWDEEWETNLRELALERVRTQVSARQFQIFQFHVLQGWSVRKVCDALGVSTPQVYLAKHRITKALKAEVQRLESQAAKSLVNTL